MYRCWAFEREIRVDSDAMRAHSGMQLLTRVGSGHGIGVLDGHVAFNAAPFDRHTLSFISTAGANFVAVEAVGRKGVCIFLGFMNVVAGRTGELAGCKAFALLHGTNLVSMHIDRRVDGRRSDFQVIANVVADYKRQRRSMRWSTPAMTERAETQLLIARETRRVHNRFVRRAFQRRMK